MMHSPAISKMLMPAAKPATGKPVTQTPSVGRELASDALPKLHEGGPVQTDGDYNLKAGEHVLTAPQAKMARRHALMSIGMHKLSQTSPTTEPAKPAVKPAKKSPGVNVPDKAPSKKAVKISSKK